MTKSTTRARNYKTTFAVLASCLIVSGLFRTTNALAAEKNEPTKSKTTKILFLGNSITICAPAPRIGWNGNWGMAASAPEKDYVHLVAQAISKKTGTAPEIMPVNIAQFERHFNDYNIAENLKDAIDFKPDTIVLAIGENGGTLKTEEAKTVFKSKVLELLNAFRKDKNPQIIIRSSFWPRKFKDQIFKEVAREVGATYVNIDTLSKDETNCAPEYEHKGVAAHPGDKGMQAIAEAIFKGIEKPLK